MTNHIYILGAKRSPIGRFLGQFKDLQSVSLAGIVADELIHSSNVNPNLIQQTLIGQVLQSGNGQNISRQIAKNSCNPDCTGTTINMVCGSGMKSIINGAQALMLNDAQLVLAGGTESMSNAPYLIKGIRTGIKMGNQEYIDSMVVDGLWDSFNDYHMGITAENVAKKYNVSREEQDSFAYNSQLKAINAIKNKVFNNEIVPIEIQHRKGNYVVSQDEGPREDVSLESLAKLKPVFKSDGTVTAGNASSINDGAAMLLLANQDYIKGNNATPIARLIGYSEAAVDPAYMGIGPVPAIRSVLKKSNWELSDVELIELNEAFASQSLAVINELGFNTEIVNVNGGAIALGHPIGASGSRIVVSLIHELKRRSLKKGLAALCIGGGMGIAITIEIV